MTEIEQIESELFELNKVQFIKPTAAQLHRRQHAMVSRVQRREDKRYYKAVEKRKAELTEKLVDLKSPTFLSPRTASLDINQKIPKRVQTRIESKRRLKPTR